MGDLSKLKIAVGQPELTCGRPSANDEARSRMVERAVDAGADLLVMPGSLEDPKDVHLVVLNDSRIDVAGNAVQLDACGESYRIGLDPDDMSCDFAVRTDVSPWTMASHEADQVGMGFVPVITLRPVGMRNVGKNVLAFDGGTTVHGADGLPICVMRDDFEEDLALVRFAEANRMEPPCDDKLLTALVKTMRRFDAQVLPWNPKWVIGLSGGLDSSIVAALLVLAFGPDRVRGYNMATRFNSDATKANAADLAEALGMPLRNGSIQALVDATGEELVQYGYGEDAMSGLVLENVQARVRGHLLSTFAAVEGGVVANNGNRVEAALGYATLYGDAIGALAPIGDLLKTDLFKLARSINGKFDSAVVPENLLPQLTDSGYEWQTPPSAELADNQRDPMKWFYHDWLIARLLDADSVDAAACDVMERFLDDRLAGTEAGKWVRFYGLEDPGTFLGDLEWVLKSMRTAAFKRIQAPPAIRVASMASVDAPPEVQGEIEPSQRFKTLSSQIRSLC